MAVNFLLKRTATASKRPEPSAIVVGELAINYSATDGGLFYKNSSGSIIKVGPAEVGSTAPNLAPAGSTGNSLGEFWYDTTTSILKIYNGTGWVATSDVTASTFSAAGNLLVGTGVSSFTALPVGVNGAVVVADDTCSAGLRWADCKGVHLCGATCSAYPFTTALGSQAADSLLEFSPHNVAVGYQSGTNLSTGACNTAVGSRTLLGNGNNNTALGYSSQSSTSATGQGNVSVGSATLDALTSGQFNTALGFTSGSSVTTGSKNTLIGYRAGAALTTGLENTIVGGYEGVQALNCHVILSNGNGDIRFQANGNGAWAPSGGTSYGSAGQVLTSTSSTGAPVWGSALPQVAAPVASTDPGNEGEIASDATYFYMYTGGRWQRTAWDVTAW